MNEELPPSDTVPPNARYSLATLMELTAACAVAASLSWMIGPVASFVLMLAAFGIVFKRGWVVLVSMIVLCGMAGAHFINPSREADYVPMFLGLIFIGAFAWYRVIVRRRMLRQYDSAIESGTQETKKGHPS